MSPAKKQPDDQQDAPEEAVEEAAPEKQDEPEAAPDKQDEPETKKKAAPKKRAKPKAKPKPKASDEPEGDAEQPETDADEEPAAYDDMPSGDASGEVTQRTVDEFIEAMVAMVTRIGTTLADNKDAVKVTHQEDGGVIVFMLEVDDIDKGRVIGRQGRIASAIRALIRVAAIKADLRARLEIV